MLKSKFARPLVAACPAPVIGAALRRTDHERAPGGFDHIVADDRKAVDLEDALDLDEQAVEQPEVAASDACNSRTCLGVGEVSGIERQAELSPVTGEHERQFVSLQGPLLVGEADTAVELGIA